MDELYNHKKAEADIADFWSKNSFFTPKIDHSKKPFSIFLVPPNASGPMHVGNAFMIAIQDIQARYFRAKGVPTLWVPGTDHGGYETEITFEKILEKSGRKKLDSKKSDLFKEISDFVDQNNILIKDQINKLGASVDWTRFRYSMDSDFTEEVYRIFKQMMSEGLILRKPAMVHYCPTCSTLLSDIELREAKEQIPLYFVKFNFEDNSDYVSLATTRPEFIFSVEHVIVHPHDRKHSHLIGKKLKNPITGNTVEVIESKRKFNPETSKNFLSPLMPACIKFDYEYALMHSIPVQDKNFLDWDGKMTESSPGLNTIDARENEVANLKKLGVIEKIETTESDIFNCKKGHPVESMLALTWFLELDKNEQSLKKQALQAIEKEPLSVFPNWRAKDLTKYIEIMKSWPIARQNVWGIKIPIWYDISDPSKFLIWFTDKADTRQHGNLKSYLDQGVLLKEIEDGLERIYTFDQTVWTLQKESGKIYLPETDVFDAWFSGLWSALVFGKLDSEEFKYFYPNHSIVIGNDLVRLCVSREIVMNYYFTGKMPFDHIYFHNLINGPGGKKMSKSYGNVVTLESYLEKYGADVTRSALISYTDSKEDFILSEKRLEDFSVFTERLWRMGRIVEIANQFGGEISKINHELISTMDITATQIGKNIERFAFVSAQRQLVDLLLKLEEYANSIQKSESKEESLAIFKSAFQKYLLLLHPFMPFIAETLYKELFDRDGSLSTLAWSQ